MSLVLYAALIFVKVLAVSNWRLSTSLAVLSVSSLPGVGAGATLSALPRIAMSLLAIVTYLSVAGYWRGRWCGPHRSGIDRSQIRRQVISRNRGFFGFVIVLAIIVFAILSWSLGLLVAGIAVVLGGVTRAAHRRGGARARARSSWILGSGLLGLIVIVLVYSQLVSAVWLPHETIVDNGGRVIVGYVLNTSDGELTVLKSGSRNLVLVPSDTVHERRICVESNPVAFGDRLPVARDSVLLRLVRPEPPPARGKPTSYP